MQNDSHNTSLSRLTQTDETGKGRLTWVASVEGGGEDLAYYASFSRDIDRPSDIPLVVSGNQN